MNDENHKRCCCQARWSQWKGISGFSPELFCDNVRLRSYTSTKTRTKAFSSNETHFLLTLIPPNSVKLGTNSPPLSGRDQQHLARTSGNASPSRSHTHKKAHWYSDMHMRLMNIWLPRLPLQEINFFLFLTNSLSCHFWFFSTQNLTELWVNSSLKCFFSFKQTSVTFKPGQRCTVTQYFPFVSELRSIKSASKQLQSLHAHIAPLVFNVSK